eukprot:TRINITY_DN4571_c0_g2_i1.p1 TRINITY_DN4571_c0_g2~~TRINITY_DN4571_c0_g2_i1.p1  ORF type:complete len:194 (-),score=30.67 TRINITY_DN4571_c0_g2_i1:86-667(-)
MNPNLKLVCVGDGGIGKTAFLISFVENRFPIDYVPTVFENHLTCLTVDNKQISLELYDTAGQEEYRRLRALSYPDTDLFMVCFSVVDVDSYTNIGTKWIQELHHYCPNSEKIIVGLKTDLRDDPMFKRNTIMTYEDGIEIKEKFNAAAYYECSAFTKSGLVSVFENSARYAQERRDIMQKKIVTKKKKTCTIL